MRRAPGLVLIRLPYSITRPQWVNFYIILWETNSAVVGRMAWHSQDRPISGTNTVMYFKATSIYKRCNSKVIFLCRHQSIYASLDPEDSKLIDYEAKEILLEVSLLIHSFMTSNKFSLIRYYSIVRFQVRQKHSDQPNYMHQICGKLDQHHAKGLCNTLRLRQNGRHLADGIIKLIF